MEQMRERWRWMAVVMVGGLVAGGCGAGDGDAEARAAEPAREGPAAVREEPAPPPLVPPASAADSALVQARVAAAADSVRAAFGRGNRLGASEVAELRQDVNATQVASAKELGVRAGSEAEIRRLARAGTLVALGDSTEHWILRDMDHSSPYVTPDARVMLQELGRRFHARLDRLGLPRYRMKVTSAIRTGDAQEELRRINSYATWATSAHEFGTTVDVSHERFAVPAHAPVPVPGEGGRMLDAREARDEMLDHVGQEHSRVLQAELGRAIAEMRDAGMLHVMMENRQPVYHMTLARPATASPAAAAR